MRARSTWSLALVVATLGCNGAIDGNDTPGATGVGTGVAGSGSGTTGAGTGLGGSGSGTTGAGTGLGGSTGTGTGTAGTVGGTGAGGSVVTLPGSALVSAPTWRLANAEYSNSIRDLTGLPVSVALDPDSPSGGFKVGGVASDNTVTTYHAAAIQLATAAVAPANLAKLVPCSATGTAACAATFIDSFAPKAFRRPLDAIQRTALNQVFTTISAKYGFATGIQAVLETIFQSPSFLYHLETEEQAKGPGKAAVTGYSMASRLSYLLWSTTPDDALLAKAAASSLTTPAQVQAEATRMLADPRAVLGLRNFYEQWMHVEDLPPSKTAPFSTVYTPAVASGIRASFEAQMDAALWAPSASVTALLTSREAFVNAALAPIFGVTGVTGDTLQKVTVNTQQRAGILTHPALMAIYATGNEAHAIKRGVFVWDKVLCRPLPDPPANVPPFVAPGPGVSVRKQFETLTADSAGCQPCHVKINPVGFLFENYDTVGRYRTTDDNNQPVDSNVVIRGTGDPMLDIATANATQFADRLGVNDASVAQCMISHLYRFAAKRMELGSDASALTTLNSTFTQSGQNLKQVLAALTQTEIFLNRLNVQ